MADDDTNPQGFAAMSQEDRRRIASMGGQASPGKFTPGSRRAREAGRRGGQKSSRKRT